MFQTSRPDWQAEFDRRGPWKTRFQINGQTVGGDYDAPGDVRVQLFAQHCPDVTTVLELGSFEGGHSFALAALPGVRSVYAVEGRLANFSRALFLKDLLGQRDVSFVLDDLETFDLSMMGRFDAVFCVGLLYHLPRPWELLRGMVAVSDTLFLWTHFREQEEIRENGYGGRWYAEQGHADRLSGMSPRSFWPTRAELPRMLADCGWPNIEMLGEEETNGLPACTLIARTK